MIGQSVQTVPCLSETIRAESTDIASKRKIAIFVKIEDLLAVLIFPYDGIDDTVRRAGLTRRRRCFDNTEVVAKEKVADTGRSCIYSAPAHGGRTTKRIGIVESWYDIASKGA